MDKLYASDENADLIPPHAGEAAVDTPAARAARASRAATQAAGQAGAHAGTHPANPAASDPDLAATLQRIAELELANADLLTEKHRLETDIAVANARADERGERISSLERRADEYPKLLKAGKDEARAAGLTEGKAAGIEEGREAGIAEERERWQNMSRWKRFFGKL